VTSTLVVWPTSADSRTTTAFSGPADGPAPTMARATTQALITSMFKPLVLLAAAPRVLNLVALPRACQFGSGPNPGPLMNESPSSDSRLPRSRPPPHARPPHKERSQNGSGGPSPIPARSQVREDGHSNLFIKPRRLPDDTHTSIYEEKNSPACRPSICQYVMGTRVNEVSSFNMGALGAWHSRHIVTDMEISGSGTCHLREFFLSGAESRIKHGIETSVSNIRFNQGTRDDDRREVGFDCFDPNGSSFRKILEG
jgi:hypothetical protein